MSLLDVDGVTVQFGGHVAAAGLSIEAANVEAFRAAFGECPLPEEPAAELPLVDVELGDELEPLDAAHRDLELVRGVVHVDQLERVDVLDQPLGGLAVERVAVAQHVERQHPVRVLVGVGRVVAAMHALEIGPGDEVVTTPFTFIATGDARELAPCGRSDMRGLLPPPAAMLGVAERGSKSTTCRFAPVR